MGAWFDSVTITDEIAFATDPLAVTPTWVDVSAYVVAFTSFVGKRDEVSDFAPGYASLTLNNDDRRFDPEYTSGAYYPNVKPMRRFRRTVAVGAFSAVVFTGFIRAWPQDWNQLSGDVTVPIVDGSMFSENELLSSSAYAAEVLADDPDHYWPLDTTGNDEAGSIDLVTRTEPAAFTDLGITGVPGGIQDGNLGTVGWLSVSEFNAAEVWVVVDNDNMTVEASVVEFNASTDDNLWIHFDAQYGVGGSDSPPTAGTALLQVWYSRSSDNKSFSGGFDYGWDVLQDDGIYHVAVRADATSLYVYVNGELIGTETLTTGVLGFGQIGAYVNVGAGTPIVGAAVYETAPSAARFQAHYEAGLLAYGPPSFSEYGGARIGRALDDAGFPAGLRDLDTGTIIHGPYKPAGMRLLDYLRQVERAEQGLVFFGSDGSVTFRDRATLWDNSSGVVFSDDATDLAGTAIEYVAGDMIGAPIDSIRNIVTASYANVGGITRRDTTSITSYGEQAESLDTPTLPDGTAASSLAGYVLREKADPRSVFPALTIEMRPDPDDKIPAVMGLNIGDLVTIRRTPYGLGNEIEREAIVLGVAHHNTGRDANYQVVLYLSPAPTQGDDAPYLIAGSTSQSLIGVSSGNLIPA